LQQRGSFGILLRAKEAIVLSYSRRFLLAPIFLCFAILGPAADTSEPTPKQIAQWIEQLGDNDFTVRENASKNLWQAGPTAESVLEKAVKSDDPEVVRRARELLDKFHWGIYPDTPADIVALIRAYQSSKGKPRLEVLQKLLDGGDAGLRAVVKIASAEKDANERRALGDLIVNWLPAAFLPAVTEGKYLNFERLLEMGHESKFISHNSYAAYYLLRGKLTERIAHFTERLRGHPEDKWLAETLVYLHWANGDLVQARNAAQKCGRPDLLEGILFEMGDWQALAARSNSAGTEKPADKGIDHIAPEEHAVEKWAFRAAYARLAGKPKQFENAVRELRKFSEFETGQVWRAFAAAKGLLLNDRPAEGLEILRTIPIRSTLNRREELFDLLCARLEFSAALDLAGKEIPTDKEIPDLHLARARLLCMLGDKEGEALFDRYAEHIKDGIDPQFVESLLAAEMRAGLKERALAHAVKALSVFEPRNWSRREGETREQLYFAKLFPQQATTAEVWWTVLRRQFKDESPAAVMKRLRELLGGKAAAKDVKAWLDADRGYHEPVPSNTVSWRRMQARRQALAEGALLAGLEDLAFSLLEKTESRDSLIRLGDLLAAKKQWAKAAERYRQAWAQQIRMGKPRGERQHSQSEDEGFYDPLPLYLAGDAFVHAGKETEGKKLIEQAHWMPLADAAIRDNFLRALMNRGHKEAAQRETELLIRVSEPNSYNSAAAARRIAFAALMRKDYLKAADGFERSMMRCFNPIVNFVEHAGYVNVPAQIHQLRASGLLAAGKLDEALKHVELALMDSPGYADLPIALVPELERRGHKKEATDLFNRCYGSYEKVCRTYPRCAWAHNSAAWMAVCCRRNLDAALEHAQKAVELAPNHAGYLDTLAEVLFQRGDKDKAIALQKRAIELTPKKTYYRKQLQRLEAGDPSAERPPEEDD
jgi:tetratricopeptide (TPR) repeat protein